ncbi:unnamed protein product [Enterobius vermicularis]|uniref:Neuropeptide-Like Protein n=1 Tax=Enterobius vermicularis TaxID=51028 RepID=A0A0N4VPW9_ENTVE|nr:unnamed protein product [Enterobius vermicularis]
MDFCFTLKLGVTFSIIMMATALEQSNDRLMSSYFPVYIDDETDGGYPFLLKYPYLAYLAPYDQGMPQLSKRVEKKDVDGKSDLNFRPSAFRFGKRGSVYSDDTAAGIPYLVKQSFYKFPQKRNSQSNRLGKKNMPGIIRFGRR